ncbi:MAG: 4Fe-4S single cluster domain-containing protein [Verrucomicrobiota bacterium]
MRIRLRQFLPRTRVAGPGARACVWVQGCPIHCRGCAVPWSWPDEGGQLVDSGDLARRILEGPRVEGVTLSGGEPFAQAKALSKLCRRLRLAGLSVVIFSGYHLAFLKTADRPDWDNLLSLTDLLIAGPFNLDAPDVERPWVGSATKRFHFLTERYRHIEGKLAGFPNRLEVRIRPDGQVLLNGMMPMPTLGAFVRSAELKMSQNSACMGTGDS